MGQCWDKTQYENTLQKSFEMDLTLEIDTEKQLIHDTIKCVKKYQGDIRGKGTNSGEQRGQDQNDKNKSIDLEREFPNFSFTTVSIKKEKLTIRNEKSCLSS